MKFAPRRGFYIDRWEKHRTKLKTRLNGQNMNTKRHSTQTKQGQKNQTKNRTNVRIKIFKYFIKLKFLNIFIIWNKSVMLFDVFLMVIFYANLPSPQPPVYICKKFLNIFYNLEALDAAANRFVLLLFKYLYVMLLPIRWNKYIYLLFYLNI